MAAVKEQEENEMPGDVEYGKCGMCSKLSTLNRKYYYYNIKCECHSPEHFEYVSYCSGCTPVPPNKTTITMKPREQEENE